MRYRRHPPEAPLSEPPRARPLSVFDPRWGELLEPHRPGPRRPELAEAPEHTDRRGHS